MGRVLLSHTDSDISHTCPHGSEGRTGGKHRRVSMSRADQRGCGCGLFRADPQTGAGTKLCAETESNLTQDHTGAASSWPWAWELMSGRALGDGYFSSLSAARDGEDRGIVSGRAGIVSWLSCLPRLQIFLTSQHL